jgi:hypothetical protein
MFTDHNPPFTEKGRLNASLLFAWAFGYRSFGKT